MNMYRTKVLYMPYNEVVNMVRTYLREKLRRTRGTCISVSSKDFFLKFLGQDKYTACEARLFWEILDRLIEEDDGLRVLLVVKRKCGVSGLRGIKKKVLVRTV